MKKILLLLLISIYSFGQTSFVLDGAGSTSRNNLTVIGQALGITGTTTGPYGIKGTIGLLPLSTSSGNSINTSTLLGTKQHLGLLYNNNSWADFSQFDKNSINASIVGTGISITGTSGTLDIKNSFGIYENWKTILRYQVASVNDPSNGLGIGMRTANAGSGPITSVYAYCPINTTTGSGVIQISGLSAIAASGTITGIQGDIIEIVLEKIGITFIARARNITSFTGWSNKIANPNTFLDNTSKISIYAIGGNNLIQKISAYSSDRYGAKFMFIGDSKTKDGIPTFFSGRFPSLVGNYYNNRSGLSDYIVDAGGGDQTADVLIRITSIIAKNPKNVILNIGSNDQRLGVSTTTYRSNYTSIVTQLTAAGINVIHLLPFPEAVQDFSGQYTWITTTFAGMQMIDTWNALKNPGDNFLSTTFNSGDGIHPNDAGHNKISNTIIASNYLDSYVDFYSDQNIIQPTNGQSGVPSNIFTGLSGGFGDLIVGVDNTSYGYLAGSSISNGISNSFFGRSAGNANTTGNYGSFFGYNAGISNQTGIFNCAFGANAGVGNITASNSCFFGVNSGLVSNANAQAFFGFQSGTASTGGQNSFFGYQTGLNNVTGQNNSYVGYQAGQSVLGGSNVAIGASSFKTGTTAAQEHVAIGLSAAGNGNITGTRGVYIGSSSAFNLSSGGSNSLIGYFSGAYLTSGNNNVFFGARSGGGTNLYTTASGSAFFGFEAGFNETQSNSLHIANIQDQSLISGNFLNQIFNASSLTIPGSFTSVIGTTTGGNIPARTNYYKYSAINYNGETQSSNENSIVTTGSTSSVSLSWPTITGAISYRVYVGTTTGGQLFYVTTTGNSFTDIGNITISGIPKLLSTANTISISPGIVTISGTLIATNGIQIKTGTNARMGTSQLASGTITVANNSITANTYVFFTLQSTTGTCAGTVTTSAISIGNSFTVTSTSPADNCLIKWELKEGL